MINHFELLPYITKLDGLLTNVLAGSYGLMIKLVKVMLVCLYSTGMMLSQDLHILYTQNTNGVLRNCYCPDHPLGGMEKRATFVAQWRKEHPNTLLFDSGDFLSFDGNTANDANMLTAMDTLQYSAVNLGDQEFSNGSDFLSANMEHTSVPWVASNLRANETPFSDLPRSRLLEVAKLNILVMGVLDRASFQFFNRIYGDSGLAVLDPVIAIQDVYAKAKIHSRIDLVILLSNLGYDGDRELAHKLDFIDVIIGGHSQDQFDRPIVIENTIITQCGKNGQYIGHLGLQVVNGKLKAHSGNLIPMDLSIKDDQSMLRLIAR
jgi:2',3'-cyclic-nucleotide 2'-phosphodiesterase (5'-nucleotidase family)